MKIYVKIAIFGVENPIFTIFSGFWGVFLGPALGPGIESATFYPESAFFRKVLGPALGMGSGESPRSLFLCVFSGFWRFFGVLADFSSLNGF